MMLIYDNITPMDLESVWAWVNAGLALLKLLKVIISLHVMKEMKKQPFLNPAMLAKMSIYPVKSLLMNLLMACK